MTTPERFRRRQRIEGAILILLSLFLVYTAWAGQQDDREQRACLASTTEDLTVALDKRADISVETNDLRDDRIDLLDERIDFLLSILLESARGGEQTQEEQQDLRERFIKRTLKLQHERDQLKADIEDKKAELAEAEIPPYPEGVCDGNG